MGYLYLRGNRSFPNSGKYTAGYICIRKEIPAQGRNDSVIWSVTPDRSGVAHPKKEDSGSEPEQRSLTVPRRRSTFNNLQLHSTTI